MTADIPAKANAAVASTGFKIVISELERERSPLVF